MCVCRGAWNLASIVEAIAANGLHPKNRTTISVLRSLSVKRSWHCFCQEFYDDNNMCGNSLKKKHTPWNKRVHCAPNIYMLLHSFVFLTLNPCAPLPPSLPPILSKSLDDLQSNYFTPNAFSSSRTNLNHFLRLLSVVISHFRLRRKSLIYNQKVQWRGQSRGKRSSAIVFPSWTR